MFKIGRYCSQNNATNKQLLNRTVYSICSLIHRGMSSAKTIDIAGIYPPIATPFSKDENICYDKLGDNLDKWNTFDFKGYVVQGSNGEYAYLREQERVEMVAKVRQLIPSHKLILAGSGCESTRDTIEMGRKMADAGADALLVVTPCYYKNAMTPDALEKHFEKVADESSVPIILYSVPANTGIDLAPEVIIRLSQHPNIIGLKDSGGDIAKIGNVVYKTQNEDFKVLAGSASFLYTALNLGCVGGVVALANVLGGECCELYALASQGRHEDAKRLQHRLIGPNAAVTKQFGVAGLKAAMEWFGLYGGPARSPILPLTQTQTASLRHTFNSSGFKC